MRRSKKLLKAFDKVNQDVKLNIYSVSIETKHSILSKEEEALLKKYELASQEELDGIIKSGDYITILHMPPPMILFFRQRSSIALGKFEESRSE